MNANPPINVAIGQQRRKAVLQKLMKQTMSRRAAPGTVGRSVSASGGGGRSIFGGNNSKLPIPHMTRQSRLAPALIAALGIGGAGIPDQAFGGLANGVQGNVAQQAQGIPDWAPQPDAGMSASGAPQDAGAAYQGYDAPQNAAGAPGGIDPGFNITQDPTFGSGASLEHMGLVHLGNGVYYDQQNGILRSGLMQAQ